MKQQQSITTLPPSPDEERHHRMVQYSVTMGIRMVCVILIFVVPGWWAIIPLAGAVVLPAIGVMVANISMRTAGAKVDRPSAIERFRR